MKRALGFARWLDDHCHQPIPLGSTDPAEKFVDCSRLDVDRLAEVVAIPNASASATATTGRYGFAMGRLSTTKCGATCGS